MLHVFYFNFFVVVLHEDWFAKTVGENKVMPEEDVRGYFIFFYIIPLMKSV